MLHIQATVVQAEATPRSTVPQAAPAPVAVVRVVALVVALVVLMGTTDTATDTLHQQQVLDIPQCHR